MRSYDFKKSDMRVKGGGIYSFVAQSPAITIVLKRDYGREGLCLKVFRRDVSDVETYTWGDYNSLMDCTKIQNIFAWFNLAPRVYDIVLVNGKIAQVTDFVTDNGHMIDTKKFRGVCEHYPIKVNWDPNQKNAIGDQWVDFQGFRFVGDYRQHLIERCYKFAAWGSRSEPYQPILGVDGQRDFERRAKTMRLEEIDFHGKSVLDIGCNLGNFVRYAADRGAIKSVGAELPHVAVLAYEVSNFVNCWNVDFLGLRMPERKPEGKFDVVFALSVDKQVGYDTWMADLCKEVFYLEGHVAQREETFRPRLERDFTKVEYLGMTRDHGPRPLFRCWR